MKYYYDDPLEAAWMAREFAFKYVNSKGEEMRSISGYFKTRPSRYPHNFYKANKQVAYIQPDHYELLKPQVGDVVSVETDIYRVANKNDDNFQPETHIILGNLIALKIFKIIQRDGKAFFMSKIDE